MNATFVQLAGTEMVSVVQMPLRSRFGQLHGLLSLVAQDYGVAPSFSARTLGHGCDATRQSQREKHADTQPYVNPLHV
jgi:hypothetical protein